MFQIQYLPYIGNQWFLAREISGLSAGSFSLSDVKAIVIINEFNSVIKILSGNYTSNDPSPFWLPRKTARYPK
jgi:hypothetical protein